MRTSWCDGVRDEGPDADARRRREPEGRAIARLRHAARWASSRPRPRDYDPIGRLDRARRVASPTCCALRYQRMLDESARLLPRYRALDGRGPRARERARRSRCRSAATRTLSNFGSFSRPSASWSLTSTTSTRPTVGPFEWDVKRLVSSLVVASSQLGHDERQHRAIALDAAREYRTLDDALRRADAPRGLVRDARRWRRSSWTCGASSPTTLCEAIDDVMGDAKRQRHRSGDATVVAYEGGTRTANRLDPPRFARRRADGRRTRTDARRRVDVVSRLRARR